MRYVLSTFNYLFQAVFATFTARYITMYLYSYLTFSAWDVFFISLLSDQHNLVAFLGIGNAI